MKKTHKGSCHCGAVRFEAELDLASGTTRCNCSFCHKARFWMSFAKASEFRLIEGEALLTDYQHRPPTKDAPFLHLTFCSRCGIRAFSSGGELPQFGGAFYAVNVACLDDVTEEELTKVPVNYVDGRNNHWDVVPEFHSHL